MCKSSCVLLSIWYSYRMICLALFSWACRLLFLTLYLAQTFKMLTKKDALHYCSAFIHVRSGGMIGAYAITWSRLIAIDEFHSPKIKVCLWNTMPPAATKCKKLFLDSRSKSRSQDHWPWCYLKGRHLWSMHAKYEVSISYGSKVLAKVKVDNRQTDKQTDRTKTICPRSFDPEALKTLFSPQRSWYMQL